MREVFMQKSIRTLSLFVASVLMGQSSVYSYSCVGADHNLHSKVNCILEKMDAIDTNMVQKYAYLNSFLNKTFNQQEITVGNEKLHYIDIDLSHVITLDNLIQYPYIRFENNTWHFIPSSLGPVSANVDKTCTFTIGQALTNGTIPSIKLLSPAPTFKLTNCQADADGKTYAYALAKIGYNPKNTTEPWEFIFSEVNKNMADAKTTIRYASVKSKTFLEDKTLPDSSNTGAWKNRINEVQTGGYFTLDALNTSSLPFGDYTINYDSTARQLTINKDQASGILYTSTHKIQSFAVDPQSGRIMIHNGGMLHCVIIPELVK